jgi:hypothetical protein
VQQLGGVLGQKVVRIVFENGFQRSGHSGVPAAGQADHRLISYVLVPVVQASLQRCPDLWSVPIALLTEAKGCPVSHVVVLILR